MGEDFGGKLLVTRIAFLPGGAMTMNSEESEYYSLKWYAQSKYSTVHVHHNNVSQ